jgi:hypothetical protein
VAQIERRHPGVGRCEEDRLGSGVRSTGHSQGSR